MSGESLATGSSAWAISSLEIAGTQYVQPGANANALEIWNDSGNIYQFGMEYVDSSGCGTGTFAPSATVFVGGDGALLEDGPIR